MAENEFVIFVPGVLGSNIHKRHGRSWIWYVDHGGLRKAPWPLCKRKEAGRRLDHRRNPSDLSQSQVSSEYYGEVIEQLREDGHHVEPYGYDWRMSNKTSGRLLRHFINTMYRRHQRDIVVVTHSMGGFVTRWALCARGEQGVRDATQKVRCVLHYMCPVFGAPDALYRIANGWGDPGFHLDTGLVFGNGPKSSYEVHKKWESMFEILPNNEYMEWVRGSTARKWSAFSDEEDVFRQVALQGPRQQATRRGQLLTRRERGVTWGQCDRNDGIGEAKGVHLEYITRSSLQVGEARWEEPGRLPGPGVMDQSVLDAHEFHAKLGKGYHPRTRHIYSTGIETTVGVKIRSSRGRRRRRPPVTACPRRLPLYQKIRRQIGDGSVNSDACIDYLTEIGQTDIIKVSGIEHDAINHMKDAVAEHVRGIDVRGDRLRPWRRGRMRQGQQALKELRRLQDRRRR
jgi:hypothetical protein